MIKISKLVLLLSFVATSYTTIIIMILTGANKPLFIYPVSFVVAYLVYFNVKEKIAGKEQESKKIIIILGILFILIIAICALGPAILLSKAN